ncbi:unnamed protein product [Mucor hiemalis]
MERAQFEEEKAKILEKALAGLDQIATPAQLWSSFHEAVGATESEKMQHGQQQSTMDENSDVPVSIGENERI